MLCNQQSREEQVPDNQKALQTEALQYYQKALSLMQGDFPDEITGFLDSILNGSKENPDLSTLKTLLHKHKLSSIPDNDSAMSQLAALKNALAEKRATIYAATIETLTGYIEGLGENLLDSSSLFSELEALVSRFVRETVVTKVTEGTKVKNDNKTLLSIFTQVGKWHLSAASEALKPLFMYLDFRGATFSDWSCIVKILTRSNFSSTTQQDLILPLITKLASSSFIGLLIMHPQFYFRQKPTFSFLGFFRRQSIAPR